MREHAEANEVAPGEAESPLTQWRELVQVLFERRWLAFGVWLCVTLAVAIWSLRQTPRYQATARLQVDLHRQNVLNIPDVSAAEPYFFFNHYVNTLIRELKSRGFAERVAAALRREAPATVAGIEDLTGVVQRALDARPVKDSRLVDVSADQPRADLAALIANTAAAEFVALNLERRVGDVSDAVAWLREQVDVQRDKLTASENAMRDYRDQTRMVSLEQRHDIVIAKLKSINESLTAAELDRMDAETRWGEVEALDPLTADPTALFALTIDPAVVLARQQWMDKRQDVATLARRYLEKHPAMLALTTETAELEQRFRAACVEAREAIRNRYQMARASEDGLRQALRQQEEQALALDRLLVEYDGLRRNAEADRELYEALLTRLKQTDVAGRLETNNLRVIDPAVTPSRAYRPNTPMNVLRGTAAGLVLGVLAAFVVSLADDRVLRLRLRGGVYGAPLLAVIPRMEMTDSGQRARAVADFPDSAPAEAFRSLRATLMLNPRARSSRRILITGTGQGDGKSLVAINLATVLATHGERTLLIDADLRRPSVRASLMGGGDVDERGAEHPLTHDVSLAKAVVPTAIPNLDLLAPVSPLDGPAERLASPRMSRLLAEADGYDRVIIDSPPLFSVSDPLVILPHVDGVVLVARYGKTRRGVVRDAMSLLGDGGARVFGVVLNSVTGRDQGYYYGRYYTHYGTAAPGRGWTWPWSAVRPKRLPAPAVVPPPAPAAPPPAAPLMAAPVAPAETLESRDRFTERVATLEARLAEHPEDAEAWDRLLREWARRGDLAVLAALRGRLEKAWGSDAALVRLATGHLAYGRGCFVDAADAFEAAHRMDPRGIHAREGLARARLMLGESDAAMQLTETLLRDDPENDTAHYLRGTQFILNGNYDEAVTALQRALARTPDAETLNNLAWVALQREDPDTARALATRAVTMHPGLHAAWDTLGLACLRAGDAAAVSALETASTLADGDVEVDLNLIEAYVRADRHAEAARSIERLRPKMDLGTVAQRSRFSRLVAECT